MVENLVIDGEIGSGKSVMINSVGLKQPDGSSIVVMGKALP
jgi:ABC-type lipoprotein export system ATPase subunit